MSLEELEEEVDLSIWEQVIQNQMSYSQKNNPKMKATHYSITPIGDGFDAVKYYREK